MQQGSCPSPGLHFPPNIVQASVGMTEGIAVKVGAIETDGCWEGWREGFMLNVGWSDGCSDIDGFVEGFLDGIFN